MMINKRFRAVVFGFGTVALLAASAAPAKADLGYQTGFEPPTYSLGTLNGQDGWVGSSVPVVENSIVYAGTQAAGYSAVGLTGQDLIDHAVNTTSAPGATVIVQEAFYLPTSNNSYWDVMAVNGNASFVGQVVITPGNDAILGLYNTSVGSVPVTPGQWNVFQLDLNFSTLIQSAYVNGVFIGQGAIQSGNTGLTSYGFGVNYDFVPGAPGDTAYMDNLSITVVPEPSTFGVFGLGCTALAAWKLGRRGRSRR